jgi:hypothetical protein
VAQGYPAGSGPRKTAALVGTMPMDDPLPPEMAAPKPRSFPIWLVLAIGAFALWAGKHISKDIALEMVLWAGMSPGSFARHACHAAASIMVFALLLVVTMPGWAVINRKGI